MNIEEFRDYCLLKPGTTEETPFGPDTIEVSTDSILMGNYFEVKFILDNANGNNFEAPSFRDFNVIGGPNTSTSMSFVNGEMTQSIFYSYYLEPKEIGSYFIQPASIEAGGEIFETVPMEVMVVPNPDGIKQLPKEREGRRSFFEDFFNSQPRLDFDFSFPENTIPAPPKEEKPQQPKKKKRKTVRI